MPGTTSPFPMVDSHPWEYENLFAPLESGDLMQQQHRKLSDTLLTGPIGPITIEPTSHALADLISDAVPLNNAPIQTHHQEWTHHTTTVVSTEFGSYSHPHVHHSPSSRSSSPFSATASLPLESEPVWIDEAADHSEAESTATNTSMNHSSHASTPLVEYSPEHGQCSSPPPMTAVNTLPTINEMPRPVPQNHAAPIGMIPTAMQMPNMLEDALVAPVAEVETVAAPVPVRARRRTRYTTAAVASVAARSSIPHGSPSLDVQSSTDSHSRSLDLTSNHGSAPSSERSEDEAPTASAEFDEYTYDDASPGKASKRKRASASTASTVSGEKDDVSSPLHGLDKRERNKLSASMYRKRRKVYLDSLEGKVGELDHTISRQSETISRQAHENKMLKEQVGFLKKMLAGLQNPLAAATAAATASAHETEAYHQPTNIHHGARRSSAHSTGAFLFVLLSLCLLMFAGPGSFFADDGASEFAPTGRAGRTLLSVDDATPCAFDESAAVETASSSLNATFDASVSVLEFAFQELALGVQYVAQSAFGGSEIVDAATMGTPPTATLAN